MKIEKRPEIEQMRVTKTLFPSVEHVRTSHPPPQSFLQLPVSNRKLCDSSTTYFGHQLLEKDFSKVSLCGWSEYVKIPSPASEIILLLIIIDGVMLLRLAKHLSLDGAAGGRRCGVGAE